MHATGVVGPRIHPGIHQFSVAASIADTDDRAPWSITVFNQNIFWQGLGRLRDNLYRAFDRAPVHVTVAVFRKRQPSDRRRHALDFIAYVEQACARILTGRH
jgi:hypothetical protein